MHGFLNADTLLQFDCYLYWVVLTTVSESENTYKYVSLTLYENNVEDIHYFYRGE